VVPPEIDTTPCVVHTPHGTMVRLSFSDVIGDGGGVGGEYVVYLHHYRASASPRELRAHALRAQCSGGTHRRFEMHESAGEPE
jgi:hypothetical protein